MEKTDFPFHFGPVVSGDRFYDREADARTLHDLVAGGQHVVLYAPRRYGKSSLVLKVAGQWKEEGFVCIYFDLMRVESLDEFIRAYADAALAAEGRTERGLRAVLAAFSSLRPRLTVGDDGKPSLELDFGRKGPGAKSLEEVLALPEALSSGRRRIVVVFDEFQEIAVLSRRVPAERIFRSAIQRHKRTRYVFLCSKTHLMRRMFNDRARPFYNAASTIVLGKPPEADSRAFLAARFRKTGMPVPAAVADAILRESGGVPYYVQAIALQTWLVARRRGAERPAEEDVSAALDELVDVHREVYEAVAASLGGTARRILSSLAKEPTTRFDAEYRARHFLPGPTTISSALAKLVEAGHVEKDAAGCRVSDPFHARYLRASAVRVIR